MGTTKIEWADRVWNPVRGCSRVSAGCDNCYAERIATRFSGPGYWGEGFAKRVHGQPHWLGHVALIEDKLLEPLSWLQGRQAKGRPRERVFVNSMSDLFHEALPDEAIDRVFAVMALCPHLDFLVLTKRPERMRDFFQKLHGEMLHVRLEAAWNAIRRDIPRVLVWPLPNVWLGVSVEDQGTADARIALLLDTPAAVRFVSYEPALGPVNWAPFVDGPRLAGRIGEMFGDASWRPDDPCAHARLDWIICGGESGPGARPMHPDWARSVRDQCAEAGVAFFMKQWGGFSPGRLLSSHADWVAKATTHSSPRSVFVDLNGRHLHRGADFQDCQWPVAIMHPQSKKKTGRLLDGREHSEFPRSPLAPAPSAEGAA